MCHTSLYLSAVLFAPVRSIHEDLADLAPATVVNGFACVYGFYHGTHNPRYCCQQARTRQSPRVGPKVARNSLRANDESVVRWRSTPCPNVLCPRTRTPGSRKNRFIGASPPAGHWGGGGKGDRSSADPPKLLNSLSSVLAVSVGIATAGARATLTRTTSREKWKRPKTAAASRLGSSPRCAGEDEGAEAKRSLRGLRCVVIALRRRGGGDEEEALPVVRAIPQLDDDEDNADSVMMLATYNPEDDDSAPKKGALSRQEER